MSYPAVGSHSIRQCGSGSQKPLAPARSLRTLASAARRTGSESRRTDESSPADALGSAGMFAATTLVSDGYFGMNTMDPGFSRCAGLAASLRPRSRGSGPYSRKAFVFHSANFSPPLARPAARNLRRSLGAHKKDAPAGSRGIKAVDGECRPYSRRCDVKKPQLTIGYSAALTGEEKPRGRGSAFKAPCYACTNRRGRRMSYPAVCSKSVTLLGNCRSGRNRISDRNVG